MQLKEIFSEKKKDEFLSKLFVTGNVRESARQCGLTYSQVHQYNGMDPEFAESQREILADRAGHIVSTIEQQALNGWKEPIFHAKDGTHLSVRNPNTGELEPAYKIKVETGIRVAMLKRYEPAYREATEETKETKGVLVVPAASSLEDWRAQFDKAKDGA